jgi:hypothetical protein
MIIIILLIILIILYIFFNENSKIECFSCINNNGKAKIVSRKQILSLAQSYDLDKLNFLQIKSYVKCIDPTNYLSIDKKIEFVPKNLSPINIIIVDNYLYQILTFDIYKYKLSDDKTLIIY